MSECKTRKLVFNCCGRHNSCVILLLFAFLTSLKLNAYNLKICLKQIWQNTRWHYPISGPYLTLQGPYNYAGLKTNKNGNINHSISIESSDIHNICTATANHPVCFREPKKKTLYLVRHYLWREHLVSFVCCNGFRRFRPLFMRERDKTNTQMVWYIYKKENK